LSINQRIEYYKEDLEKVVSLGSLSRLRPNPCMQKKNLFESDYLED
jgi:hypothetical protein